MSELPVYTIYTNITGPTYIILDYNTDGVSYNNFLNTVFPNDIFVEQFTSATGTIDLILPQFDPFANTYSITITVISSTSPLPIGFYNFYHPVPCFVSGTRVLTQNGYKAVETLNTNDRVKTGINQFKKFKLHKTFIPKTNMLTAPYIIEPNAFGKDMPFNPVRLSPTHKILIGTNSWISPEWAIQTNNKIKQYGVGEPVTYYHIECENYFTDNIITEGLTVESFGTLESAKGNEDIYKFNNKLKEFTRIICN